MEPSVLMLLFPVFYIVLAVDLVAFAAAIAFMVADRRAARANDWRLVARNQDRGPA
jgi:hypothetical protein